MKTKTWNLTLTPESGAPSTLSGLSQADMIRTVYDLMHGSSPEVRRTETVATAREERLAA
jgi:hypothetical protein